MTERVWGGDTPKFAARRWITAGGQETVGQIGCLVQITPEVVGPIWELRPEPDPGPDQDHLPLHGGWAGVCGVTVRGLGLAMVLATAGRDTIAVGVMTKMVDGCIHLVDEAYRDRAEAWRLDVGYSGPWPAEEQRIRPRKLATMSKPATQNIIDQVAAVEITAESTLGEIAHLRTRLELAANANGLTMHRSAAAMLLEHRDALRGSLAPAQD